MASPKAARSSSLAPPAGRQLTRYRSMRDFKKTAEPRGGNGGRQARTPVAAHPFVVQKHAATRLHYDFRLAWDGVLKSWAVTKGPSLFPGDKRLAVRVEDHPMEYAQFEGTIPKGQYGGGAVMVWDRGEWKPHEDVDLGLKKGHLKFDLEGQKLNGTWTLVRMHGRFGSSDKENWLLIKDRDSFARSESDAAVVDESPESVLTGRSIEEIARGNGPVWNSNARRSEKVAALTSRPAEAETARISGRGVSAGIRLDLKNAPREKFPGFVSPELAQQSAAAPGGSGWIHEIKLDGYRIQLQIRRDARKKNSEPEIKLLTRKGLDWSARMPDIARAASRLKVESAILDGEAVTLDKNGISDFAALQAAFQENRQRYITYFAFDLLHLNGYNTRDLPLLRRKQLLAALIQPIAKGTPIRLGEHIEADGQEVFAKACALGAEGIVSKLASSKYVSGRGTAWLKLKCIQQQEFVIGGFTELSTGSVGVGALLLGYYDDGNLRYAGRSGTGFTERTHRTLRRRLDAIVQKTSPFDRVPRDVQRGAIWVKPELVAQIAFTTWTRDNLVRQAAFKGLREDKPAHEVVREGEVSTRSARTAPKSAKAARAPQREDSGSAMELAISHPDKVLDEESGLTKRKLAEYYMAVADHMLPHIANRPLSVVRCPEGNRKPCFFQKHIGPGLPKGLNGVSITSRKTGEKATYLTLNSAEGLLGLAQMGVLEIHPWGSKNDSLERADRIVFDLDPDAAIDWKTLAGAAKEVQACLQKHGLQSYLKSTGGKGLHVVVPIEPDYEWPLIKQFAHNVVLDLEREKPGLYVTKMTKASRKNRIYLDYLRNDRDATSIAPFSPRARVGAPVAMPLSWSELKGDRAPAFHVSDYPEWRSRLRRDPWKSMVTLKQRLREDDVRPT